MKKFKTYGKFRTATNFKSDEWDELTKTSTSDRPSNFEKEKENIPSDYLKLEVYENSCCVSKNDASLYHTIPQPLHDVTAVFENLSIENHSTPILPNSTSNEKPSSICTPLKHPVAKRLSSSSDYSFTCKRFVSIQSINSKNVVEKRISGIGNITINSETPKTSLLIHHKNVSFKDALSSSVSYSEAEGKILSLCEQDQILLLKDVVGKNISQKIGEGSYGEVYLKKENGEFTAVKIVPVGDVEDQMKYNEVLPEIAISKKLSNWKLFEANKELYPDSYVQGFIELKRLSFCKGPFTPHLKKLWEDWELDEQNDCQNAHPDVYDEDQKYVVFENAFGGQDLEKVKITTVKEAMSILKQLVATLASAECSIQFEHRDLHWGNILIKRIEKDNLLHVLVDGQVYEIPSAGVAVSIIDFTLARLVSEGCAVFTDLSDEQILFNGEGDPQFDVYREMKKHNNNDWESFNPYTNVLWIHYITNKLVTKLRKCVTIKKFASRILEYNSCCEILLEDELFE